MPLNGRNFLALAQLSDGVVIPPGGTRGEALQQAGPLPNVGGQRSGHNIYLLDGTKVTDELFNNLVINPSVDSIEEFKIQKSMYPAEFGGKASALINVATKAGSNRFRGSLFEFNRNDAFDSANYFQPAGQPTPPLRQNQFGGSLGGPVLQNRTFFFGSYEGQRMNRSLTRTFSVPPEAVRAGNFSGYGAVCDPLTIPTTGIVHPVSEQPDPGEPPRPDRHGAAATRPAALVGRAASKSRVRRGTGPAAGPVQRAARSPAVGDRPADCPIQHLRCGRESAVRDECPPGNAGARVRPVVDDQDAEPDGHSHARLWELAVERGAVRVDGRRRRTVERQSWHRLRRTARLAGRHDAIPATWASRRFPQAGCTTRWAIRRSSPRARTRHFELFDNVTLDRGAHRLKFGAYFFHLQLNPEQPDAARGAFTYTGQFSGNAFADFLLGYPTSATSGIGRGDEHGRTNWIHLYAQDDWQARDNLTFNLGLRYEYNQHMYDVDSRLSSVDLAVPGGRYVIASDERGPSIPRRRTCCRSFRSRT